MPWPVNNVHFGLYTTHVIDTTFHTVYVGLHTTVVMISQTLYTYNFHHYAISTHGIVHMIAFTFSLLAQQSEFVNKYSRILIKS